MFPFWGESKDFPRSPSRLFLLSHWPEFGSPDQLWLQKGLGGKSRAFPCLILGTGLGQVGRAECCCLSTKPGETEVARSIHAKGGRFACLSACLHFPLGHIITNCNLYLSLWFGESTKGLISASERRDTKAGSFVLFLLSKDSYEACLLWLHTHYISNAFKYL